MKLNNEEMKELFSDYAPTQSKKVWVKIEQTLDKNERRIIAINRYKRWSAAASIALLFSIGYLFYQQIESNSIIEENFQPDQTITKKRIEEVLVPVTPEPIPMKENINKEELVIKKKKSILLSSDKTTNTKQAQPIIDIDSKVNDEFVEAIETTPSPEGQIEKKETMLATVEKKQSSTIIGSKQELKSFADVVDVVGSKIADKTNQAIALKTKRVNGKTVGTNYTIDLGFIKFKRTMVNG